MEVRGCCPLISCKYGTFSKAHGIVCSPMEISLLRKKLGNDFLLITPGFVLHGQASVDAVTATKNLIILGATAC